MPQPTAAAAGLPQQSCWVSRSVPEAELLSMRDCWVGRSVPGGLKGPSEGNWGGGCALAKRVVKVNMGECSILRYLGPCQSMKNSHVGG